LKYPVALLARNPANYEPLIKEIEAAGGKAIGISTDVTDGKSVANAFEKIKAAMTGAQLAAAVFNVGGQFIRKPFLELNEDDFMAGMELMDANCTAFSSKGAFHFAQACLPLLLEATSGEYPPTLIFTSATAAMKGSALCSSFATGKFAMRALAQSLAREFGPKGVHVAHAIIDGVIDIERTKDWKFDAPDAKISPHAVSSQRRILRLNPSLD
jgi:NAD(P)-dependent dehydrogenase (short-subunit alcohol dehydrogenase family)